jgi:hypothetical protein
MKQYTKRETGTVPTLHSEYRVVTRAKKGVRLNQQSAELLWQPPGFKSRIHHLSKRNFKKGGNRIDQNLTLLST